MLESELQAARTKMAMASLTGESDPTGKSPHQPGAKLDNGKAPLWQGVFAYFPRALKGVALVSLVGANKYAWNGWQSVPGGVVRYRDALCRHLECIARGEYLDADTGRPHHEQVAWNALAVSELEARAHEQPSLGSVSG